MENVIRLTPAIKAKADRRRALRNLLDLLVWGADEAPNRISEGHLRDAAARVGDALAAERRALQ